MKKAVEIELLGQKYRIKTALSSDELDEILLKLNTNFENIRNSGGAVSTHKLAAMVALLSATENFIASKKIDLLIKKISDICN